MGSESDWMETLVASTEKDLSGKSRVRSKTQHDSITELLGFFCESSMWIICIDFMPIRQHHVWC